MPSPKDYAKILRSYQAPEPIPSLDRAVLGMKPTQARLTELFSKAHPALASSLGNPNQLMKIVDSGSYLAPAANAALTEIWGINAYKSGGNGDTEAAPPIGQNAWGQPLPEQNPGYQKMPK